MVARSEDKPRTMTDRVADASARLDEVNRALGRGAPALRDSAGNVLEMNADAPYPLLTPQGIDAAVAFTSDGTVKITSPDTTQDRDLTARSVTASATVTAGTVVMTGNSISSRDRDGAVRWGSDGAFEIASRDGSIFKGIRSSNFETDTPSWRRLKTGHRSLTDVLGHRALDEVIGYDISAWRYDPDAAPELADGREHIGLHYDEVHPRLLNRRVGADGEVREGLDLRQMLNVALAAVQDLSADVAALRSRVTELEGVS